MKRALARQDGATFIEIIAAVGIFSFIVVGLSPSLLSTRTVADLGKNRSVATTLATDKIEQIRTLSEGALASGSDGPLNASGGTTFGTFSRSWSVTANTPISGISRVEMTVTWTERAVTNSLRLVALVRS